MTIQTENAIFFLIINGYMVLRHEQDGNWMKFEKIPSRISLSQDLANDMTFDPCSNLLDIPFKYTLHTILGGSIW
jgi:hypothetical protein